MTATAPSMPDSPSAERPRRAATAASAPEQTRRVTAPSAIPRAGTDGGADAKRRRDREGERERERQQRSLEKDKEKGEKGEKGKGFRAVFKKLFA